MFPTLPSRRPVPGRAWAALILIVALFPGARTASAQAAADGKVRVIVFGAHPDDCELRAGGSAAKWAALGHHVKFVSVTNGDIGHWRMAGGPLAKRRLAEVKRCAEILGIETEVLDIHDGELEPNLENRRKITRLIRGWKADVVISHRPNDYHPDHRYVGVLVQDAAYMVTVPFITPDTPHLNRNPVFLFSQDGFQKPNPFQADIVVAIDDAIEKKLACMDALESQFYEGGANGGPENVPSDPAAQAARRKAVRDGFAGRFASPASRFRTRLEHWYGKDAASRVRYAEAFEICEYGRQPGPEEIRRLFPFFPLPPQGARPARRIQALGAPPASLPAPAPGKSPAVRPAAPAVGGTKASAPAVTRVAATQQERVLALEGELGHASIDLSAVESELDVQEARYRAGALAAPELAESRFRRAMLELRVRSLQQRLADLRAGKNNPAVERRRMLEEELAARRLALEAAEASLTLVLRRQEVGVPGVTPSEFARARALRDHARLDVELVRRRLALLTARR